VSTIRAAARSATGRVGAQLRSRPLAHGTHRAILSDAVALTAAQRSWHVWRVSDEPEMTIGEVARRAGVTTSTVRYYERIGLLAPDRRQGAHRRYREATLRRLVFIGMMQDAGLSLDEIAGVLEARTRDEWRDIARGRLAELDAQIERLQRARTYLEGALRCRYDHPATECEVMGSEIDRRLAEGAARVRRAS
jgi:MerR family redox-sensitive transcriptional activator SoxR